MQEDVLLVSAWVNVSMDAIQGADQSRSAYWNRICDFFHANKYFSSDRSQNSLMHRWSTIQECLNTFAGCVSRIENRPQSGANAEDKVKINLFYMLLLEDEKNRTFQFMHCYKYLKDQPKWIDW
ncbi:Os07g0554400 [Oryza sativa Japonica Group]|uniref:Os07g0554400 protein n=1 Tax=Oryza sativa subsp. japonica TaxID=39947 RepID=A0A0P0X7C1_ORYSJ|nr:hypothetical protein EE612_039949 [Oryza sativa]BAT02079.1 Os07g0554400 [Oryza sativa Japonica Group]